MRAYAGHGWVVGRRAKQTQREFYVLLDDNISTLTEVQGDAET